MCAALSAYLPPIESAASSAQPNRKPKQTCNTLTRLAASVLAKVLYGARNCRFDLMRTEHYLLLFLHKWDKECDHILHRRMRFIHSELDLKRMGWVSQDPDYHPMLHLLADADFAGCLATQRSTTGCFLCIAGRRTRFPIHSVSKRQTSVGVSTPEVKCVAARHGLTYDLIPRDGPRATHPSCCACLAFPGGQRRPFTSQQDRAQPHTEASRTRPWGRHRIIA